MFLPLSTFLDPHPSLPFSNFQFCLFLPPALDHSVSYTPLHYSLSPALSKQLILTRPPLLKASVAVVVNIWIVHHGLEMSLLFCQPECIILNLCVCAVFEDSNCLIYYHRSRTQPRTSIKHTVNKYSLYKWMNLNSETWSWLPSH